MILNTAYTGESWVIGRLRMVINPLTSQRKKQVTQPRKTNGKQNQTLPDALPPNHTIKARNNDYKYIQTLIIGNWDNYFKNCSFGLKPNKKRLLQEQNAKEKLDLLQTVHTKILEWD